MKKKLYTGRFLISFSRNGSLTGVSKPTTAALAASQAHPGTRRSSLAWRGNEHVTAR